MIIPQFEPSFGIEEQKAASDYLGSGGWITENKKTEEFERQMADFLGIAHTSCVNNGTISLSLALLAVGLKSGDKVIVPDITMIATATAARFIGIEPVFVDVNPWNLCLDLEAAAAAIQADPDIRGVLYVSLNGRSHSGLEIAAFRAKCPGIAFIEDAAQSFGSKVEDGRYIGSLGDIGSFSFSPHKIISTGQGGALASTTRAMYEKVERLKDFGRLAGGGDVHDHFGINSKFTDLQAVIGMEQLKKVVDRIATKKRIYRRYEDNLQDCIEFIHTPWWTVPWFVDVYPESHCRGDLIKHLDGQGIKTRPIYPALHSQRVFSTWNSHGEFTVADSYSTSGLWLPSSLHITNDDIDRVCEAVRDFYSA
jgi:perosamine synthetase